MGWQQTTLRFLIVRPFESHSPPKIEHMCVLAVAFLLPQTPFFICALQSFLSVLFHRHTHTHPTPFCLCPAYINVLPSFHSIPFHSPFFSSLFHSFNFTPPNLTHTNNGLPIRRNLCPSQRSPRRLRPRRAPGSRQTGQRCL